MTTNCIIKQIDAGRMPEDMLCVLTPILAKQKDPVAAELLNSIGRRGLWRRWGFESLADYTGQAGITDAFKKCAAVNLLLDELEKSYMRSAGAQKARLAVTAFCGDSPVSLSDDEFATRYGRAMALIEGCRSEATQDST